VRSSRPVAPPSALPPAVLLTVLLFPAALILAGCAESVPSPFMPSKVYEISKESAGDNFRILRTDRWIYLTYPDLGALSLNLVRLGFPEAGGPLHGPSLQVMDITYLDRITETPEIGEGFGIAPLVLRGGLLNVFYSDREREGTPVLKWVSNPTQEDKWWIDILPYSGEPLAVLPAGEDDLDLYLLRDEALVRQSLVTGESEELLSPCDPAREVCVVGAAEPAGITFFDRRSQRLYAFLRGRADGGARVVYTAGAAHHSILLDGRLRVLLFSPQEATLVLLEEQPGSGPYVFAVTPVTLCEGTTSVFLGYTGERPYFLYNERAVDQDGARSYLLTLLTPTQGRDGETRYQRAHLLQLDSPVRRFSVSEAGSSLHVFFVQETLKMLTVELDALSSE